MNKQEQEQAQQLRLSAELIETGHPFEFRDGGEWIRAITVTPDHAICERRKIRPILATPPDGRPLHNPDGLSAEQVGIGYRLTLTDDRKLTPWMQRWSKSRQMWDVVAFVIDEDMSALESTYRLPLTAPWPEAKPDPYAELKAAHAAGKAIEVQMPNGECFDYKPGDPQWNLQPECYRIKPEPATKQVELGPDDVPPCSVVSGVESRWLSITCCHKDGVYVQNSEDNLNLLTWSELLRDGVKINRSIPLTGKWDASAWEPCSKEVQA